jgi:spermidine synthase
VHQDGQKYLETTTYEYDLIVIDAFMGVNIPPSLSSHETVKALARRLSARGVVAMNIIGTYYGRRSEPVRRHVENFAAAFPEIEIFPADSTYSLWTSQNLILTGRLDKVVEPAAYLRFGALPPMIIGQN